MDHALLRAQISDIVNDTTIPDRDVFTRIRDAHAHLLAQDMRTTATNLLKWLDNRPFTSLETLVIELRANLEEVRDGIRDDIQQSMRLSRPTDG